MKEVRDVLFTIPAGMDLEDLFEDFDRIKDPPPGCKPQSDPVGWYYEHGSYEVFPCPLVLIFD